MAMAGVGGLLGSRRGTEGIPDRERSSGSELHASFQVLMAALKIALDGLSSLLMRELKLRGVK